MLNIKWIISNPDKADKAFKKRGLKPLANKLIKMSQSRSQVFVKLENLLEQRNNLSKEILSGKIRTDSIILLDSFDDNLVFRNQEDLIST